MEKWKGCIDLQVRFNEGKNLFHKEYDKTMKFTPSTVDAIQRLHKVDNKHLDSLIEHTIETVLGEFCRVNQYFSFHEEDKISLRELYRNLHRTITKKEIPVDIIAKSHYENLRIWLAQTNPFSQTIYTKEKAVLDAVICSEYTAQLQKEILRLGKAMLQEPILDVGCGKNGSLVKSLLEDGYDAFGIDRFSEASHIEKTDWFTFDYGVKKWGTIISNLGFSNHFTHNHIREDGNFIEYAQLFMKILNSLKVGGCFHYAPDLPFIEKYLDGSKFSITKHNIEDLPFKATIIKRLA